MDIVLNNETVVGAIMTAAVISALMASSLFRNVGLAVVAAVLCVVYVRSGGMSRLMLK